MQRFSKEQKTTPRVCASEARYIPEIRFNQIKRYSFIFFSKTGVTGAFKIKLRVSNLRNALIFFCQRAQQHLAVVILTVDGYPVRLLHVGPTLRIAIDRYSAAAASRASYPQLSSLDRFARNGAVNVKMRSVLPLFC